MPARNGAAFGSLPRWLASTLLLLAVAGLVLGAARWWPRTVDDAFITFRYSDNLTRGVGPVFNPGERVEGYSSPTWMLLMAGAIALGADPVPAAKWLGLAASLLCVWLVFVELRRLDPTGWAAGAGALLLGSSLVLQIWSVAGMETNAYALFFLAGLLLLLRDPPTAVSDLAASALLVAAALTRPEGVAFWVVGGLVVVVGAVADRWRRLLRYAAPGTMLLAHLVWRLFYYGEPLPNTYYAKTGGGTAMWRQGVYGLWLFVSNPAHTWWLVAAITGATACLVARRHRRHVVVLGGAVLLHLLYVVSVGDDGLRVHRFYVPVLGPLAVLAGLSMVGSGEKRRRPQWWIGLLTTVVTVFVSTWTFHARMVPQMHQAGLTYQHGNVKLGRFLARQADSGSLVAVAAAGAIPFYSRLPTIDMYGLNDPHIARVPFPDTGGGRLMKWDNDYVLGLAPDWIVINRGYFAAGDDNATRVVRDPAMLAVSPMDRDLFARLARDDRYALGAIRFDDGSVFFVFAREGRIGVTAGEGERP